MPGSTWFDGPGVWRDEGEPFTADVLGRRISLLSTSRGLTVNTSWIEGSSTVVTDSSTVVTAGIAGFSPADFTPPARLGNRTTNALSSSSDPYTLPVSGFPAGCGVDIACGGARMICTPSPGN